MKSSIGQESAAERADIDRDGVADQAETTFEETSRRAPQPGEGSPDPARTHPPGTSRGDAGLDPVLPDRGSDQPVEAPFNSN